MEDQRFSHIKKDPKFRKVPKGQSKIKIDNRFKSMFTDKQFQVKYTVDKRGRPVKHHSKEDLERYYEISSEGDTESSEEESEEELNETGKFVRAPTSEEDTSDENNDFDEGSEEAKPKSDKLKPSKYEKKLPDTVKDKLKDLNVDYARGELRICSDSSSDDEETDEEVEENEIDHRWGELDGDADTTDEVTNRLAACNLDWDRIRAVDIMVLINSFMPPGGVIHSVTIYPSEFGKQRMKEEDIKGPIELVDAKKDVVNDEEGEEGSQYHMEKLRQYQLNRLKYYYAVITFDSPASANKVYTECDGLEYESSSTKMDLRFIPDDMTFDDQPKESCDKIPEKYQPRFFTTTALQQAKVDLTWDETNPDRLEFTEKLNSGKIDDLDVKDFHNFLAGSSSEDDDEERQADNSDSDPKKDEDAVSKYKALLQDIKQKESKKKKDVELEISWGINLKEKTDELAKKKEEEQEKTPFEKYIEKRKQKQKEKRSKKKEKKNNNSGTDDSGSDSDMPSDIDMNDEYFAEEFQNGEFNKPKSKKSKEKNKKNKLKDNKADDSDDNAQLQLLTDDIERDKKHFSLKKIIDGESDKKSKKKKKSQKNTTESTEDDFKINVEDNRFSALFTSHHYNIDPSDPHYKKTKAMENLIQEKLKRRNEEVDIKQRVKKPKSELNILVKSVKRKANAFKNK